MDFDDAPGFQKGDFVTFLPYLNCGKCISCRSGKSNCCTQLQTCGVHIDGGMSDYFSIPSRLLVKSGGLSLEELAMVEPLAIGAHGIARAAIQPGEFVLVMGAGPIGLGTMAFARLQGAKVIAADKNMQRLDFCKTKMGISHIIEAGVEHMTEQLMHITGGDMPTVVIDASGNRQAINNGLNYLAHGGRYVLIGLQKDELILSHPEFHKKEATLMSSRNATRKDFDYVIRSIQEGLIFPLLFITNRVKFKDAATGFPGWLNPASGIVKVMVEKD